MSDHAYPAIDTAEQRLKLWKEIEKAGGIERYIKQTLQGYGFSLPASDFPDAAFPVRPEAATLRVSPLPRSTADTAEPETLWQVWRLELS